MRASIHSACGLDLDDIIQNPLNVLRELTASFPNGSSSSKHNGGRPEVANFSSSELLVLANPTEALLRETERELRLLPSLIEPSTAEVGAIRHEPPATEFKCNCPRLTVDEQRSRYCERLRDLWSNEGGDKVDDKGQMGREQQMSQSLISLPRDADQLREFGPSDRNGLAKGIELAKRLRLYARDSTGLTTGSQESPPRLSDELSLALYAMEGYLREANNNLAADLAQEALGSALVLADIWRRWQTPCQPIAQTGGRLTLEGDEDQLVNFAHSPEPPHAAQGHPVVMIRAPVSPDNLVSRTGLASFREPLPADRCSGSSAQSRLVSWSSRAPVRCDSGVELECEPEVGGLSLADHSAASLGALEELARFRADPRVQRLVRLSMELFQELLNESPLFKLINGRPRRDSDEAGNNLFTLQELRLYACIECQRLRASIRFKWITQCLVAAFEQDDRHEKSGWQVKRTIGAGTGSLTAIPNDMLAWLSPSAGQQTNRGNSRTAALEATTNDHLPPIEAHKQEDSAQLRYFDSLALLMGQLLRQQFLVPALERWFRLLEAHQFVPVDPGEPHHHHRRLAASDLCLKETQSRPKIGIQVELLELSVEPDQRRLGGGDSMTAPLVCSRPEEELKDTLGFVVDELASVCRRLPRLETQLESFREPAGGDQIESSTAGDRSFILTLETDDNLLEETKRRLNHLIDRSIPLPAREGPKMDRLKFGHAVNSEGLRDQLSANSVRKPCDTIAESPPGHEPRPLEVMAHRLGLPISSSTHGRENKWLDPDYLLIVELVNNFRLGLDSSLQRSSPDEADDRLVKLGLCGQQIRLLDALRERLTCELGRYQDHGLVVLDYGPLLSSLLRSIQKERLLLIRMRVDELLRLMDRVRLQFEEIEFGVDLEAAIEDYLAERRQAKQSQYHQQVLIDSGDDDANPLMEPQSADCPTSLHGPTPTQLIDRGGRSTPRGGGGGDDSSGEEDEFVEAISQGHSSDAHKLLALGGAGSGGPPAGDDLMMAAPGGGGDGERRGQVVALIECQLLLARYEYVNELLSNELGSLAADVRVSYEGLVFLSDFVGHEEQLEPTHWELIGELLERSRHFRPMLSNALDRLQAARARLRQLNELRSRVLSRLTLEFHLLIGELAHRLLVHELPGTTAEVATSRLDAPDVHGSTAANETARVGHTGELKVSRRIGQLDAIQETAEWARELEMRFSFLVGENSLVAREGQLLAGAKLVDETQNIPGVEEEYQKVLTQLEVASESRSSILDRWRPLASALSSLWRLVEEYENQQIKWLSSDTKRIDFKRMDLAYRTFCDRLARLRKDLDLLGGRSEGHTRIDQNQLLAILDSNIGELDRRLSQFAKQRLPLFRFLTNRYLTEAHWRQVAELLQERPREKGLKRGSRVMAGSSTLANPQACTTLAQFLELGADKHVDRLEEIHRQAMIEHELTSFLLAEASKLDGHKSSERRAQLKALDLSGAWFSGWTDKQLVMAATRFIEAKLLEEEEEENDKDSQTGSSCHELAQKLVSCHSTVRRYLRLSYGLNLDASRAYVEQAATRISERHQGLTLRTCKQLASPELVSPSLFVEFLRLFTRSWLRDRADLAIRWAGLKSDADSIGQHLDDIEVQVARVRELRETDLQVATSETEATLVELERETIRLEMEREILATKESLALDRQREALGQRDSCIRQITERAIPAIRAAARALDCLDTKSLRTLRYIRPNPPDSVRLVLEAVCLLRSCVATSGSQQLPAADCPVKPMEPERRFDALSGRMLEDYWPPACRMLNGTHSTQFIRDLRRVDKRAIPRQVMRLIRRRYLSSGKFQPRLIERISPECALLAKWLIAVDVFDRVINVVRPNYGEYLESERRLASLLSELNSRRSQIDSISRELQRMEESFEHRMASKMSMAESLDQCKEHLRRVEATRKELEEKRDATAADLDCLGQQRLCLPNKCLLSAAKTVYLEAMGLEERISMESILRRLITAAN